MIRKYWKWWLSAAALAGATAAAMNIWTFYDFLWWYASLC